MKTNELNMNEMEQVNGGTFFSDVKDLLLKLIPDPFDPMKRIDPPIPELEIARGKC